MKEVKEGEKNTKKFKRITPISTEEEKPLLTFWSLCSQYLYFVCVVVIILCM